MSDRNNSKMRKHKIGSTTYLVTRSFQQNAKEDAAQKMAKVVQNEARRQMKNLEFSTSIR